VDGLAAVRMKRLDPIAHATGLMIFDQLKRFFSDAVGGKQPWCAIVRTWPEWVQELDDEAVRSCSCFQLFCVQYACFADPKLS
jgi:hypothetical protein